MIKDKLRNILNKCFFIFNNDSNYEKKLLNKYGKCSVKKEGKINILFIADTHNCLEYDIETLNFIKTVNNYECCILLGDHSANDLNTITKIIPKHKLYGVLGNHDSWQKYDKYLINDINGKVINIDGVRIAGISGSFKYKDSEEYALYSHEESIKIAKQIPDADILVTHDRPFIKKNFGDAHDGLKGITEYIYSNHISLHIHGHLHEESEEKLKNGTISVGIYKARLLEL